jgi:hypothetical protein
MPLGENKEVAKSEDKPIMEAIKRLSVVNEDQDKYTIAVSKHVDINDYIKSLLDVTHYEVHSKRDEKFKIVLYNKSRVVKSLNNCICKNNTLFIPRVEIAKRRCFLYNAYIMLKLF